MKEEMKEQEKRDQQQARVTAATKVTTSDRSAVRSNVLLVRCTDLLMLNHAVTFDPAATGLVERLHGPPRPGRRR